MFLPGVIQANFGILPHLRNELGQHACLVRHLAIRTAKVIQLGHCALHQGSDVGLGGGEGSGGMGERIHEGREIAVGL